MKNEDKKSDVLDAHTDKEGIYFLEPKLVNGKQNWVQVDGKRKNAIWCDRDGNWIIGGKSNLGSMLKNSGIHSRANKASGPHLVKEWVYKKDDNTKWIPTTNVFLYQGIRFCSEFFKSPSRFSDFYFLLYSSFFFQKTYANAF